MSASAANSEQMMIIDRLALETGCASDVIRMTGATTPVHGKARAYRLEACEGNYVCTADGSRIDCKAALSGD